MRTGPVTSIPRAGRLRDYLIPVIAIFLATLVGLSTTRAFLNNQQAQAILIDLSGRQRMLSQRFAKEAIANWGQPEKYNPILEELKKGSLTLEKGGVVQSPHAGGGLLKIVKAPSSEIQMKIQEEQSAITKIEKLIAHAGNKLDSKEKDELLKLSDGVMQAANESVQMYLKLAQSGLKTILVLNVSLIIGLTLLAIALFRLIIERRLQLADMTLAKEAALRASTAKSSFLANMSHEIRTPLNAIIGISELFQCPTTPAQHEKLTKTLQRAAETLLALVDDILDLSKIEAGGFSLNPVRTDISEIVERIKDMMEIRATRKGLTLGVDVSPEVPNVVVIDGHRIRQVLINLVGNAIKFTSQGSVTLSVKPRTKTSEMIELEFSVSDTGIGISPENQKHIFEKFAQADSTIATHFGGTGLGLAISKKIVELMGGDLSVKSSEGVGSKFSFIIPCQLENASKVSQGDTQIQSLNDVTELSPGKSILVVDDVADNRAIISSYLQNVPVKVVEASSGQEALDLFLAHSFDLILMDIRMAPMDGYEAIRKIREIEKQKGLQRTPITALTAYALQEELEKAKDAGSDSFLTKPITKERLMKSLEETLGSKLQAVDAILEVGKAEKELDSVLKSRFHGYLKMKKLELVEMQKAFINRDFQALSLAGHNLAGTSGMYSLPHLSDLGKSLELSADNKDIEGIRIHLRNIQAYLYQVVPSN